MDDCQNITVRTMNFVQNFLWLSTLEFEATNGKYLFGRGLFSSYHALKILIFIRVSPTNLFQISEVILHFWVQSSHFLQSGHLITLFGVYRPNGAEF